MSAITAILGSFRKVNIAEQNDPTFNIDLDCSESENHSASSEITSYPVEEGPDIADNSRPKPKSLTLNFYQSSPILDAAALVTAATSNLGKFDSDVRRGEDLYEVLIGWKDTATALSITTTLTTYNNMLIEDIQVPRTAQTADGIFATVKFTEIFVATSATVAAPVVASTQPKAAPKTAVGAKTTPPVTDNSVAFNGYTAVFGSSE